MSVFVFSIADIAVDALLTSESSCVCGFGRSYLSNTDMTFSSFSISSSRLLTEDVDTETSKGFMDMESIAIFSSGENFKDCFTAELR